MNTTSTPEEKLAAAIALSAVAAEMTDRLKALFDADATALPIFFEKDPLCQSMIPRKARTALRWINYLGDYFNATDAVDFEEDEKWDAIIHNAAGVLGFEAVTAEHPQ